VAPRAGGGLDRCGCRRAPRREDDSCLIIDESSFPKQGERSVGVARQWSGRLGKVDNCTRFGLGMERTHSCGV
jgi:hypothetical protein